MTEITNSVEPGAAGTVPPLAEFQKQIPVVVDFPSEISLSGGSHILATIRTLASAHSQSEDIRAAARQIVLSAVSSNFTHTSGLDLDTLSPLGTAGKALYNWAKGLDSSPRELVKRYIGEGYKIQNSDFEITNAKFGYILGGSAGALTISAFASSLIFGFMTPASNTIIGLTLIAAPIVMSSIVNKNIAEGRVEAATQKIAGQVDAQINAIAVAIQNSGAARVAFNIKPSLLSDPAISVLLSKAIESASEGNNDSPDSIILNASKAFAELHGMDERSSEFHQVLAATHYLVNQKKIRVPKKRLTETLTTNQQLQ